MNNLLKKTISEVLLREVNDQRLAKVVITDVETAADLGTARVYYSLIGSDEDRARAAAALAKAGPFIQGLAGETLRLRHTPRLKFFEDESLVRAQRIETIIRTHKQETAESAAAVEDPGGEGV